MKNLYETRLFEDRKIYMYNDIKDSQGLLFIINDGAMIKNIENNIFQKLEENVENIMVVFVDSHDRFAEYTPWEHKSTVNNVDYYKGQGDEYLSFILGPMLKEIEKVYGLSFSKKNIFLGGSSLGGLIASYGLFEYADQLGGGIFVSSSYWYGGFIDYLEAKDISLEGKIIYMDVGDLERPGRTTMGKDIIKETQKVFDVFLNKQIDPENIRFILQEKMGHNQSFFIDRIYDAIIWISRDRRI